MKAVILHSFCSQQRQILVIRHLQHVFRSNCFIFIIVFAFQICPLYTAENVSYWLYNTHLLITHFNILDSYLVSVYTSTSLQCLKLAAKHLNRHSVGTQVM